MTIDKFVTLASYISQEPDFDDSAERCYKYPFVATEAMCIEKEHIAKALFDPNYEVLKKMY